MKLVSGLSLHFDAGEQDAAEIIADACEKSVQLISRLWGIEAPRDCRVYVMTSWTRFVFMAAPWHWRILLVLTAPSWWHKVKKLWPYVGGMAQRFGRRRAVGVKPPRLIQTSDRSIGEQVFNPKDNFNEKARDITCHELVHAYTASLRLPAWLNEGLAMVTVDRLSDEPTVKKETIQALDLHSKGKRPEEYKRLGVEVELN